MAWNLRTLIVVFAPGSPLRFLNLNLTRGLTGLPFDQWRDVDAASAVDLQACLEGREGAALDKRLGATDLAFDGAWPHYTICYRAGAVALDLAFDAAGSAMRWARAGAIYTHSTRFGRCTGTWRWNGAAGRVDDPALLDHGFGVRMRGAGALLRRFRYEVLRLPDDSYAIGLLVEGPGGVVLRRDGMLGGKRARFERRVLRRARFPNYAGAPRSVPEAWTARIGTLAYRAQRATPPRAVLGDGFLSAFDYDAGDFKGGGYAEQLGVRGG